MTDSASEFDAFGLEIESPPGPCPYLPDETASMKYRQQVSMSGEQYEKHLARGWRRQGVLFFRPQCPRCDECRSLRVAVPQFKLRKSQRRCLRRNQDVLVQVVRPRLTEEHLQLFNEYHRFMHRLRGWPDRACTAEEYATAFLLGTFDFAYEFQYFRKDRLVGVGLVDLTPHVSSSIYFYHAPEWRDDGPGVFSMLTELQYAASQGLDYVYLGYWIRGCPSMAYKANYGPHELLSEYVEMTDTPCWKRP